MKENIAMDNSKKMNSKSSVIEFLDLEDLDEIEKTNVLGWLQCSNDSILQLPWQPVEDKLEKNTDSLSCVNNTTDTQERYETCNALYYQCLPNTQGIEYVSSPPPQYPVYPNTQYINYYPQTAMTHANASYVYAGHVNSMNTATSEMYYPQQILIPMQPVQMVPNNNYYNSVSNVVTDPSVYASNNTNNDPSAASPTNTSASVKSDESKTPQQNGSTVKSTEKSPSTVQNGTAACNGQSPAAPKTWASLFGTTANCDTRSANGAPKFSHCNGDQQQNISSEKCPIRHPKRSHFIDPVTYQLAEYLKDYSVEYRSVSLQPRGLLNKSNYCYINSILQAMLACPQLYHLLQGMKNIVAKNSYKSTSTIEKMCLFIKEFSLLTDVPKVRRSDKTPKKDQPIAINCGTPFEPTFIHKMLNGKTDSFQIEGRQEDAEEFLGVLLNALNDEMAEFINLLHKDLHPVEDINQNEDDKEWHVMGKKNKSNLTRKAEISQTPISNIFGGLLKSRVDRNGDQPTDNIQPFFTLQLNIEKVKTVRDALDALANKIQLEGVTCTKTNKEVEAWQQTTIDKLPEVLILHLKCFDYRVNGCTKIIKMVEFPIDLKIDSKLLSPNSKNLRDKDKQYKLFAIVYHDGKEANKGHYFTDAFHSGYGTWLRYDDAIVKPIQEEQVLKPQGSKVPYLLFYRRCSDRNK